jgi:hypothetical protein
MGGALVITTNTVASSSFDFIAAISDASGTPDAKFRVRGDGNVFADGAFTGGGADYAEYFKSKDTDLQPAEAVCMDPTNDNQVMRCTRNRDINVIGVVSTNPSFVGNNIPGADGDLGDIDLSYKLVGLIGQIPANVIDENGEIHPGDSLTPATVPGYLMKADAGDSTVGVAMESWTTGQGSIKILISRRNKTVAVEQIEQSVADRIAQMGLEDKMNVTLSGFDGKILDLNSQLSVQQKTIDDLKADMDLLRQESQAIIDFASLIHKNGEGGIDLIGGRIVADELEAGSVSIKVDGANRSIGKATILSGDNQIKVSGSATDSIKVDSDSKIFITPESDPGTYLWVEKDSSDVTGEFNGFVIRASDSVKKDTIIDWWIIEEKNNRGN